MQVPDVLQQHRSGHDLPGVANEILEQLELLRQQLDRAPVALHCAAKKIHLQVAGSCPDWCGKEKWRILPES